MAMMMSFHGKRSLETSQNGSSFNNGLHGFGFPESCSRAPYEYTKRPRLGGSDFPSFCTTSQKQPVQQQGYQFQLEETQQRRSSFKRRLPELDCDTSPEKGFVKRGRFVEQEAETNTEAVSHTFNPNPSKSDELALVVTSHSPPNYGRPMQWPAARAITMHPSDDDKMEVSLRMPNLNQITVSKSQPMFVQNNNEFTKRLIDATPAPSSTQLIVWRSPDDVLGLSQPEDENMMCEES